MKIRSISYRENRASPDNRFQHQHIELTADLVKGESADKALALLQVEVRKLLYPELVGLRERISAISSLVAKQLKGLNDAQLGALFTSKSEQFEQFLAGRLAVGDFLYSLGL